MNEDETVLREHSETERLESDLPISQNDLVQPITAGALLRDARQAQGLDIVTLSASLKVPVQKLHALEQNQFDLLLDPVFARALASSMCRILRLDPAPVLQRLPAITAFKVTPQNRGINKSFNSRDGGYGASIWSHISRPAILVGLALLLGTLMLIFLPTIQQEIAKYRQENHGITRKNVLADPVSIITPVTTQVIEVSDASTVSPGPPGEPPPIPQTQAFISTPAAASTTLAPTNTSGINANAMINFSAKGESWVKVADAKGVVVLSRTLRIGESASASGVLPLAAIVGRADAIQVFVRGQAFDLGGVTKNNVARFEVK